MTRDRWWDVIWIMALAGYMLAGVSLVPFHGDESTLLYLSQDYAHRFINRNIDPLFYDPEPASAQLQDLRLLNGAVNQYLMGLTWHLAGFSAEDLNEQWDWGAGWEYNQQNGHAPANELLAVARWPSALLMAAGVAVMFLLGREAGGRPTAYLASLYYALNPALLVNGQRAMQEGSFTFFSLLTVLAGIWLVRRGGIWRTLLLGLSAGLALGSKHTAAFIIAAVWAAALLILTVRLWRSTARGQTLRAVGWLALAGVLALLTFYALNPAWWGDPLGRASTVLDLREELLAIQVDVFGGYATFADQAAGFVQQALIAQPQYYEASDWQTYIGDQIARYEASPWHGVAIGGSGWGAVLLLILLIVGGWRLLCSQSVAPPARWILLSWSVVMVGLTLGLTPLAWQRYYVPVFPVIGLLAALGIVTIIKAISHRLWRFPTGSPRL